LNVCTLKKKKSSVSPLIGQVCRHPPPDQIKNLFTGGGGGGGGGGQKQPRKKGKQRKIRNRRHVSCGQSNLIITPWLFSSAFPHSLRRPLLFLFYFPKRFDLSLFHLGLIVSQLLPPLCSPRQFQSRSRLSARMSAHPLFRPKDGSCVSPEPTRTCYSSQMCLLTCLLSSHCLK
jgi:hypothetical protein